MIEKPLTYEQVLALDLPNIIAYAGPVMIGLVILEWCSSGKKNHKVAVLMKPSGPVTKDELVAVRRDIHRHPEIGFDERFDRMWNFYLACCPACFRANTTDVTQLSLRRTP